MLKIYGALLSPFVRKVRCVLTEKSVAYELVATNPFGQKSRHCLPIRREADAR